TSGTQVPTRTKPWLRELLKPDALALILNPFILSLSTYHLADEREAPGDGKCNKLCHVRRLAPNPFYPLLQRLASSRRCRFMRRRRWRGPPELQIAVDDG